VPAARGLKESLLHFDDRMVQILGLVSLIGMSAVGLIVCGRMLLLARRTREIPEFAMGGGLLSIMVLGAPLSGFGRSDQMHGTDIGAALLIGGLAFSAVGIWLLFLFTWKVFRPTSAGARRLVVGLAGFLVVLSIAQLSVALGEGTPAEIRLETRPYGLAFIGVVVANFLWGSIESLAYRRRMLRQLAIGLASPALVNRFLLWGIGGAVAVVTCVGLMVITAIGGNLLQDPTGQLVLGVGTILVATCWYLTFLPPRAYLAWIDQRASRGQDASGVATPT
jgi:hypothetical protein